MGYFLVAMLTGWSGWGGEVSQDVEGVRGFPPLPPVGIHPRVLITGAEKDDLRVRMYESEFGRNRVAPKLLPAAREFMFRGAGSRLQELPETLTVEEVEQVVNGHTEGVSQYMGVVALEAWVNDDAELKTKIIRAAVNQARVMLALRELKPDHSFWRNADESGRDWGLGEEFKLGGIGLAATYDLLFNDMTAGERDTIRKAISVCISGRRSHGLGWPKTKLFSNWFPLHGTMAVMMLCIEGEEGYDPEIYELWRQGLTDWLEVGISANGANHEDGYMYYALRGGMSVFLAAERRGDPLAHHPRFRNLLRWQAMWEPTYGPLDGYQTFHAVLKYLYPKDPVANMFWARRVGPDYQRNLSWQSVFFTVLCGMDYEGSYAEATDYSRFAFPQSKFDKRRGVQMVRNGFGERDLLFRMHARADSMFVGHAAVDSGSFELQSHGREWVHHTVGDKSGSFHSYDYSLVHIDGKAQGMKPPIVNVTDVRDEGAATLITADLTYAYNWQWFYGWPLPGVEGRELPGAPWVPEKEDPYQLGWPTEETWLPHDISNQPDLGFEGVWQMKKRINNVDHAFRSAVVARGEHPYVLIVDDVKQDDQERRYEWLLSTPGDVRFAGQFHNDIVLQDGAAGDAFVVPAGTRRLLVRMLAPFDNLEKAERSFYGTPPFIEGVTFGRHQSLARHTQQGGRTDVSVATFHRLSVPFQGTEGRFVALLFPYETTVEGGKEAYYAHPLGSASLPETAWNADRTQLTVTVGDQLDVYTFTELPTGRRKVSLVRNGEPVL